MKNIGLLLTGLTGLIGIGMIVAVLCAINYFISVTILSLIGVTYQWFIPVVGMIVLLMLETLWIFSDEIKN